MAVLLTAWSISSTPALAQGTGGSVSRQSGSAEASSRGGDVADAIGLARTLFAIGRGGGCDRIVVRLDEARADRRSCEEAEQAVNLARQRLQQAQQAADAERERRAQLDADRRARHGAYQAALAQLQAAEERAAAARAALASAEQRIINALAAAMGADPSDWLSEPPDGASVVEAGESRGRGGDYYQALTVAPGLRIYIRDRDHLWNPTNSMLAAARLRNALRWEIDGGADLLAALAAAQAELEAAEAALAEAAAAEKSLGEAYFQADQLAHGLPPLTEPLGEAEEALDKALRELEKCRERQAEEDAERLRLEREKAECERRMAAAAAAEAAANDAGRARSAAADARRAAGRPDPDASDPQHAMARTEAERAAAEAEAAAAAAEAAKTAAEAGDRAAAEAAAGTAAAAATRAESAAESAANAAAEYRKKLAKERDARIRQAQREIERLHALAEWLRAQGMDAGQTAQIEALLARLRALQDDLERGDIPWDVDPLQFVTGRLAELLGISYELMYGSASGVAGGLAQSIAGVLYTWIEVELRAAAERVGRQAQLEGSSAESIRGLIVRAQTLHGQGFRNGFMIIDRAVTGTDESYFIIRTGRDRYIVFKSSASSGVSYYGEVTIS